MKDKGFNFIIFIIFNISLTYSLIKLVEEDYSKKSNYDTSIEIKIEGVFPTLNNSQDETIEGETPQDEEIQEFVKLK